MKFFGIYILPLLLILGALYLIFRELIIHRYYAKRHKVDVRGKIRLARKVTGAILVIIIAVMIAHGLTGHPPPTPETFHIQMNYWLWVFGIALATVIIAFWDAYEGVKNLETSIDQSSIESLEEIDKIIRSSSEK